MKKLYRSRSDEMIAGVCGGLAEYLDIDPTIVRLVFVILLFAGLGGLWIYLVLWVITPLEPTASAETVEVVEKKEPEEPGEPKKIAKPRTAGGKKSSTSKKSE